MNAINTVTVIGANGTMGCNVSAIFASFGNAKVYMVSRKLEDSEHAVDRACKSVRAGSISKNLIPVDFSSLEKCVAESDLVFESVAENFDIKADVTKRVALNAKSDAVLCSGTSGLSITKLAEILPEELRENYLGVHMFNPPYNMTLCELITTKYTSKELVADIEKYLSSVLRRTVVNVLDVPAFLGNRIGFQFINQVLQYAEEYKYNGGVDYIDAIFGPFTGRAMAPLVTSDFVGLDVHKAIVDNVYNNADDYAKDTFVFPEFACKLVTNGNLGRKSVNGGLYKKEKSESGKSKILVYDVETDSYRDKIDYKFNFVTKMNQSLYVGDYVAAMKELVTNQSPEAKMCCEAMLKYILYSLHCSLTIGGNIHASDAVMATGFNWCPPLAMLEAFATVEDFETLVRQRIDNAYLQNIDFERIISLVEPSKYDYRVYFKTSR